MSTDAAEAGTPTRTWGRFLALGDSVTQGIGDDVDGLSCRSWADWTADGLREDNPRLDYLNIARGGATTADVLLGQFADIDRFEPDLMSVTIGANDARALTWKSSTFRESYARILEEGARVGAHLLTATYPDIREALGRENPHLSGPWRLFMSRIIEVNKVIREVGAEYGAAILEFESSYLNDPQYLSRDMVHPNALAYRKIGGMALRALRE